MYVNNASRANEFNATRLKKKRNIFDLINFDNLFVDETLIERLVVL